MIIQSSDKSGCRTLQPPLPLIGPAKGGYSISCVLYVLQMRKWSFHLLLLPPGTWEIRRVKTCCNRALGFLINLIDLSIIGSLWTSFFGSGLGEEVNYVLSLMGDSVFFSKAIRVGRLIV